jgi:prepilin-type processing-associated H-X9-DG protein
MFTKTPWAGVMTGGAVRTTAGAPVYTAIIELAPTMVMARAGKWALNSPYSEPYDFFSAHPSVVHFLFADGSVQVLSSGTEHAVFHALATRHGGDVAGDSF